MTGFDAILLALIAISVLFAVVRGGLKELGTLVALGLAALAALFLAEPAASLLGGGVIALLAAAGAIAFVSFLGFQIGVAILVSKIGLPPQARLANRVVGGFFGLARALVLVGLLFLGYAYILDEEHRPTTVNDALLLPVAKASAAFIESLAPGRAQLEKTGPSADGRAGSGSQNDANDPASPRSAITDAYDRAERKGLDELVTTMTTRAGAGVAAGAGQTALNSERQAGAGDPVAALITGTKSGQ